MDTAIRSFRLALLAAAFCLGAIPVQAADPSAPARDNIPRIWRALSGDRVELDGKAFDLHGVTCPAAHSDSGRKAKALLNIFLRGTKHSPGITCTPFGDGRAVECKRAKQTAAALMIDSGLCHAADDTRQEAATGPALSLTRHPVGPVQISYWRLRSCLGVHPAHVPAQCGLASRTWPLRYAEAALWLERQNFSRCPPGVRPAGSGTAPNRYSLRPLLPTHCLH